MKDQNYSASLLVAITPQEAFQRINSVSRWWTENLEGHSLNLNDEFTVQFGDIHYSKQKVVEVIPDQKVVWLVTDSKLNFIEDQHEWTNTKISFEIARHHNQTQIHFTHIGLTPHVECYNQCIKGWDYYLKGSLFQLLTEAKGTPELKQPELNR